MDIINIIIFLFVFLMIMWLQHNDDIKFKKSDKRTSLYDKIKIPLVSALFVVLIKELDIKKCTNFVYSILVIKPPPIFPNELSIQKNVLNDIYVGPPDF